MHKSFKRILYSFARSQAFKNCFFFFCCISLQKNDIYFGFYGNFSHKNYNRKLVKFFIVFLDFLANLTTCFFNQNCLS